MLEEMLRSDSGLNCLVLAGVIVVGLVLAWLIDWGNDGR